jgi:Ion channel
VHARPSGAVAFRYGAMLLVTLATLLISLVAPDGVGTRTAELLAAGTCLLIAVATSEGRAAARRTAVFAVGLAIAGAAVFGLLGVTGQAVTLALTALLLGATIAAIGGGLVRLIVQRGVVVQAVFGALAVYLLLGLTFAFLIGAAAVGFDTPYFGTVGDGTQAARTYFSFTALTTTGFGDLTAAYGGGRMLAVLEMLIGQLYLVTVISLLVGNLRRPR